MPSIEERRIDLLFKFNLMSYDAGIKDREHYKTYGLFSISPAVDSAGNGQTDSGTAQEGPNSMKGKALLWVGMALSELPKGAVHNAEALAGTSVDSLQNPRPIATQSVALKVVVVVGSSQYLAIKGEALGSGIAGASSIKAEDVFFFREFRDDSLTDPTHRELEWQNKVQTCLTRLERGFDPRSRASKHLLPDPDLMVDLNVLSTAFDMIGVAGEAENCRAVRRNMISSLAIGMPLTLALQAFTLAATSKPPPFLVEDTIVDLKREWPMLADKVDQKIMDQIYLCIVESKIHLPLGHALNFVLLCRQYLVEHGNIPTMTKTERAAIGKRALASLESEYGRMPRLTSSVIRDRMLVVKNLLSDIKHRREQSAITLQCIEGMIKEQLFHPAPLSLAAILHHLETRPDKSNVKSMEHLLHHHAFQIGHALHSHMIVIYDRKRCYLEYIKRGLEKLAA